MKAEDFWKITQDGEWRLIRVRSRTGEPDFLVGGVLRSHDPLYDEIVVVCDVTDHCNARDWHGQRVYFTIPNIVEIA